jgi:hypothetical protein
VEKRRSTSAPASPDRLERLGQLDLLDTLVGDEEGDSLALKLL